MHEQDTESNPHGTLHIARATFGDVFAVGEFRALWLSQLLSVIGDQLARVALTLLVYDRTHSALLAAVTFAASVVPIFLGGITLAGVADRLPRRRVMIICDVLRAAGVLAMAVPGMPLAALVALLFTVTMVGTLFSSARAAVYPEILSGDRYLLGNAVTLTTNQLAQVVGFAAGGLIVGFAGVRTSLLADAATFAASALLIRIWVHARPASRPPQERSPSRLADMLTGARLVFALPALRTPMLLGWLAAFYNAPEGIAAPLSRSVHSGSAAAGLILAVSGAWRLGRRCHLQPPSPAVSAAQLDAPAGYRLVRRADPLRAAASPAVHAGNPVLLRRIRLLPGCSELGVHHYGAACAPQPGIRPSSGGNEPGPGRRNDPGGRRGRALRTCESDCGGWRAWRRHRGCDRCHRGRHGRAGHLPVTRHARQPAWLAS